MTQLEYTVRTKEWNLVSKKGATLGMKSGKRHLTDGIELPSKDKIRTLREKKTKKYLGILEADTIKQMVMKTNLKKNKSEELESYTRQNNLAETISKE